MNHRAIELPMRNAPVTPPPVPELVPALVMLSIRNTASRCHRPAVGTAQCRVECAAAFDQPSDRGKNSIPRPRLFVEPAAGRCVDCMLRGNTAQQSAGVDGKLSFGKLMRWIGFWSNRGEVLVAWRKGVNDRRCCSARDRRRLPVGSANELQCLAPTLIGSCPSPEWNLSPGDRAAPPRLTVRRFRSMRIPVEFESSEFVS